MDTPKLSIETETFLRYLAAPRIFQIAYAPPEPAQYEYDGLGGNARMSGGLPLIFICGSQWLKWETRRFTDEAGEFSPAGSRMFQLSSLLWYVTEVGDYIMSDLEYAEAEEGLQGDADGMWELIRRLASEALAALGLDAKPPVCTYKEVFVAACFKVPGQPQ